MSFEYLTSQEVGIYQIKSSFLQKKSIIELNAKILKVKLKGENARNNVLIPMYAYRKIIA